MRVFRIVYVCGLGVGVVARRAAEREQTIGPRLHWAGGKVTIADCISACQSMGDGYVLRDEVLHDVRGCGVAYGRIVSNKTLHWRRGVDLIRHVGIAFLRIWKGEVLRGASW